MLSHKQWLRGDVRVQQLLTGSPLGLALWSCSDCGSWPCSVECSCVVLQITLRSGARAPAFRPLEQRPSTAAQISSGSDRSSHLLPSSAFVAYSCFYCIQAVLPSVRTLPSTITTTSPLPSLPPLHHYTLTSPSPPCLAAWCLQHRQFKAPLGNPYKFLLCSSSASQYSP